MFLSVTAWFLIGALPGLIAVISRDSSPLVGAGIGAIGGVTAGTVVSLLAGPGTLVAEVLAPPAALVGGTLLLANLTRPGVALRRRMAES